MKKLRRILIIELTPVTAINPKSVVLKRKITINRFKIPPITTDNELTLSLLVVVKTLYKTSVPAKGIKDIQVKIDNMDNSCAFMVGTHKR